MPRAPCGGSAPSSSSTSTRRCSTTTSGQTDRLAEMDRDLDNSDNGVVRTGTNRLAAHALTSEPPDHRPQRRWRTEMTAGELAEFESVAGELLAELGYELSTDRTAAGEGVE